MIAKEMFEKLGYKQNIISNIINYTNEKERSVIQFTTDCTGNSIYVNLDGAAISIEEYRAINKQVSELGWNKEGK